VDADGLRPGARGGASQVWGGHAAAASGHPVWTAVSRTRAGAAGQWADEGGPGSQHARRTGLDFGSLSCVVWQFGHRILRWAEHRQHGEAQWVRRKRLNACATPVE
jgi:hypothetical protein